MRYTNNTPTLLPTEELAKYKKELSEMDDWRLDLERKHKEISLRQWSNINLRNTEHTVALIKAKLDYIILEQRRRHDLSND